MITPTPINAVRFTCARWTHVGPPGVHYWHMDTGWRKCSHCGSMHPDDMIEAVREAIRTGGKDACISEGKTGKHYVRGRTEGGSWRNGKFYGGHMPLEKRTDPRLNDELGRAIKISWDATFPPEPDVVDKLGDLVKDDDGGP